MKLYVIVTLMGVGHSLAIYFHLQNGILYQECSDSCIVLIDDSFGVIPVLEW